MAITKNSDNYVLSVVVVYPYVRRRNIIVK